MFKKIMVPVDLTHKDQLKRALDVAADLASHYGATACYVGVTTETPSSLAHTPEEYEKKLAEFAEEEAGKHGHKAESKSYASHDPSIDVNDTLMKAAGEIGADLVVIASHIPNIADHLWPSHGGSIAYHAKISVFVVR